MSLFLLIGFHSTVNGGEKEHDYSDIQFSTHIDRKIFLSKCGKKALESEGEEKEEYLKLYFRALPRDFETFFKTTNSNCYDNVIYKIIRSSYSYSRNPWSKFHPLTKLVKTKAEVPQEKLYAESKQAPTEIIDIYLGSIYIDFINIIPKPIYFEKMIDLSIGGFGEGGDIIQESLLLLVSYDLQLLLELLSTRTDDEIAGFCFFYYDRAIHPAYEESIGSKNFLCQKIERLNPRIAKLMDKAYSALLAEWEADLPTR
eukprot:gene5047-6281_t